LRIIADEDIPLVNKVFSKFGEVITIPGRKIENKHLRNANILLTRSVTKINSNLLKGTSIYFIGTATSGTDHIDKEYLIRKKITLATAAGCNSESVAEYVITSMLSTGNFANLNNFDKLTCGIIGVGNVGHEVNKKCKVLGLKTILYDPPKENRNRYFVSDSLDKLLSESDIITFHVPLTKEGKYKTYKMIDNCFLNRIKKKVVQIINTSRGDVINQIACMKYLSKNRQARLVLDVWPNEPIINLNLLKECSIATSHIAGYSYDSKLKGTEIIYKALSSYLNDNSNLNLKDLSGDCSYKKIIEITKEDHLADVLNKAYPIFEDDCKLRKLFYIPEKERPHYFDSLRKYYPKRYNFKNYLIKNKTNKINNNLIEILKRLGFIIDSV